MKTLLALALLGALVVLPAVATALPPPCEAPIVDVEWCRPPYFGPDEARVCGVTHDFLCNA